MDKLKYKRQNICISNIAWTNNRQGTIDNKQIINQKGKTSAFPTA